MKRASFIVLWTVIFAGMIFAAWIVVWQWVLADIATIWTQDSVDRVQLIAYSTYIAVPLLGLILGALGKLPGTRTDSE